MMVGREGLEPSTSRLSSARSNQLSYKPEPLHADAGPQNAKARCRCSTSKARASHSQIDRKRRGLSGATVGGMNLHGLVQEERETKTAAVPHDRPDWPYVFQEIR